MLRRLLFSTALSLGCLYLAACDSMNTPAPATESQVHQASANIQVAADGLTSEQHNVKMRLEEDNKPGAIKHLYVISPYSGQVILYSTVKGKVTSSGKRLTPTSVAAGVTGTGQGSTHAFGIPLTNGELTSEVMQDDGTYGQSGDYLYWWDVRGAYHQHYLTGGQIVTISDQPLPIKSVIINIEANKPE